MADLFLLIVHWNKSKFGRSNVLKETSKNASDGPLYKLKQASSRLYTSWIEFKLNWTKLSMPAPYIVSFRENFRTDFRFVSRKFPIILKILVIGPWNSNLLELIFFTKVAKTSPRMFEEERCQEWRQHTTLKAINHTCSK